MAIPDKKIVTYTDLKTLIDTEGFTENNPFPYTSLKRCNKDAVLDALIVDPGFLSTSGANQLIAREKIQQGINVLDIALLRNAGGDTHIYFHQTSNGSVIAGQDITIVFTLLSISAGAYVATPNGINLTNVNDTNTINFVLTNGFVWNSMTLNGIAGDTATVRTELTYAEFDTIPSPAILDGVLILPLSGDNPPTAPTVWVIENGLYNTPKFVKIEWTGATDDIAIDSYNLYWSDNGGTTKHFVENVDNLVYQYTFTGMFTAEAVYRLYVVTVDSATQESPYTGYVDVDTRPATSDSFQWDWRPGSGASDFYGEFRMISDRQTTFKYQVEVISESGTWHIISSGQTETRYLYDTDVISVPHYWQSAEETTSLNPNTGEYFTHDCHVYRQSAGSVTIRLSLIYATNYALNEYPAPFTVTVSST